jgi:hypothetical protein
VRFPFEESQILPISTGNRTDLARQESFLIVSCMLGMFCWVRVIAKSSASSDADIGFEIL